jgi:TIR domain
VSLSEILARCGDLAGAVAATRESIRVNPQQSSYRDRMRRLCGSLPAIQPPSGSGISPGGKFLTLEEAACRLGLRPEQLVARARRREVRGFLDGGIWRFRAVDIDALVLADVPAAASDSDFELNPSNELIDALQPDSGADFELSALDASDEFEATPMSKPSDSDVTASDPKVAGINLSRPSDSGINLKTGAGLGLGQADSIELAPLSDEAMETAGPKKVKPSKAKPSLAATPPPAVKKGEKDIFDDTDFEVDVNLSDSDSDDKTVQLEAASDFDLEDNDTGSEVFAIDEEAVEQNASTAMAPSAFAEDDEDEEDDGFDSALARETTSTASRTDQAIGGRPDLLRPVTDKVHFSLTAPAMLEPGRAYVLDVWAHLEAQRAEMLERARESQGSSDLRVKSKGGVLVARGAVLTVRLTIPTLEVADPEDLILWDREIGNATFPVSVPSDARLGPHEGTATFHVDLLGISKLHFVLEIGRRTASVAPLGASEVRCKRAFASYASEDRDEVLGRLQGILKVLPELDLFLDVASLRSGERWEDRLYNEIARRETLFLFWSLAASQSPWVEREWRAAMGLHGLGSIDPVPLVSPEEVPPPAELAQSLHFNDWTLAFMRGRGGARTS